MMTSREEVNVRMNDHEIRDCVRRLLALVPNWDSYRAFPIDPSVVNHAFEFLSATLQEGGCAPQIVPTVRGGLQLEWHMNGGDLEVEIHPSGDFELSFEGPTGESNEFNGRTSEAQAARRFVETVSG